MNQLGLRTERRSFFVAFFNVLLGRAYCVRPNMTETAIRTMWQCDVNKRGEEAAFLGLHDGPSDQVVRT